MRQSHSSQSYTCTLSLGLICMQILPFCSEETLVTLETNLGSMPSVTQLLNSGLTPQGITDRYGQSMVWTQGERVQCASEVCY